MLVVTAIKDHGRMKTTLAEFQQAAIDIFRLIVS